MKHVGEREYNDLVDAARERERLAREVNKSRRLARQAAKKLLLTLPIADRGRLCDEVMALRGDMLE